jgi:uncharacterized protein YdcH (DUF465 family)
MEDYLQVVEEVKKLKQEVKRFARLKHELAQERARREEMEQTWNQLHQRQYEIMKHLKLQMDDRVEGTIDKTHELNEGMKEFKAKLMSLEDSTMELEDRIGRLESGRDFQSRSLTPVLERSMENSVEPAVPERSLADMRITDREMIDSVPEESVSSSHLQPIPPLVQLPFRTEKRIPHNWKVKVIFMPNRNQPFAFHYDSTAAKRCRSRGLEQEVSFASSDAASIIDTIDRQFKSTLRGRPWTILTGYRPQDEPYGRIILRPLSADQSKKEKWNHAFIDQECVVHDKMQGDLLYIALEKEDLSWTEIRYFLSPVTGSDESCWAQDEELDGPRPFPGNFKSLDQELMDDQISMEPPPYSSRTTSIAESQPSRLDLLATAAMNPQLSRTPTTMSIHSASDRASFSDGLSFSEKSISTMDLSDDEHSSKKLRLKASVPSLSGSSTSTGGPMYVSGRSKRKLPTSGKVKEPVHWDVNLMTRSFHAIRKNKSNSKDKVEPSSQLPQSPENALDPI